MPALFQISTVKQLRTVLFWVIMHQVVVRNYQYSLHNNPEEHRSYNFACFIWVGKLISHKRTTILAKGDREEGAKEDTWV